MCIRDSAWKAGNGSAEAQADDRKRQLTLAAEPNVVQFLEWRLYDVQCRDGRILSCDAHHNRTGEALRFSAPQFIDCSGDAWLGFRAGAEFRYGRESRHEFEEGWDKFHDLWSPETADRVTMGVSLMWNTREVDQPVAFPAVPWAMPVAKDCLLYTSSEHQPVAGRQAVLMPPGVLVTPFTRQVGDLPASLRLDQVLERERESPGIDHGQHPAITVSYTHLDVYKRQV